MVCPWFRIGDRIIRTVVMVARFDHPAETTLDELRVELMYPADDLAEQYFRGQARGEHAGGEVENGDADGRARSGPATIRAAQHPGPVAGRPRRARWR